MKQSLRLLPEITSPAPRRGKAFGARNNPEDKVGQAGKKYNRVCSGIGLISFGTSKYKHSWFTPGPELSHPERLGAVLPSAQPGSAAACSRSDVPWSHVCSLPPTGITCSPCCCSAGNAQHLGRYLGLS